MPWYGFIFLGIFISGVFVFMILSLEEQKKLNDEYRFMMRSINESLMIIAKSVDK